MSKRGQRDVLDEVVADHEELKQLFAKVSAGKGARKRTAFQALVRKLIVHETAEQEVVHPLLNDGGAKSVRNKRLAEEKKAEEALWEALQLGTDDPQFETLFSKIQVDVLTHAEMEEAEEHPKIRSSVEGDRLRQLAKAFRAAESSAPTRPHPHGPTSAAGNLIVGPFVAVMDRARDAVRDVMQGKGPSTPARAGAARKSSAPSRTKGSKARSKATTVLIEVSPDPKGGWRAGKQGSSRAIARSDSKQDVVRRARAAARAQKGRLVIHRKDGRVQEERSYGKG